MSTSAYFMDISPQYRDNGCPSQCMGMNEYTTIPDMYSKETDPTTALLSAGPMNPYAGPNSTLTVPQPTVQAQVQPQNQQDLFANVVPANANQLTNLTQGFGLVDPAGNYRTTFTGLVYPVSGSIKNRVGTRFGTLEEQARKPDMVATPVVSNYGFTYPVGVAKQTFGEVEQKINPVHLRVPRA